MLADLLRRIAGRRESTDVTRHNVHGIDVVVYNTRPDIQTDAV